MGRSPSGFGGVLFIKRASLGAILCQQDQAKAWAARVENQQLVYKAEFLSYPISLQLWIPYGKGIELS